LSMSQAHIWSH